MNFLGYILKELRIWNMPYILVNIRQRVRRRRHFWGCNYWMKKKEKVLLRNGQRNVIRLNGFKFRIIIDKTEMKTLYAFPGILLLERRNVELLWCAFWCDVLMRGAGFSVCRTFYVPYKVTKGRRKIEHGFLFEWEVYIDWELRTDHWHRVTFQYPKKKISQVNLNSACCYTASSSRIPRRDERYTQRLPTPTTITATAATAVAAAEMVAGGSSSSSTSSSRRGSSRHDTSWAAASGMFFFFCSLLPN